MHDCALCTANYTFHSYSIVAVHHSPQPPIFLHHCTKGAKTTSLVPRLLPSFLSRTFIVQYATKAGEEPGNEAKNDNIATILTVWVDYDIRNLVVLLLQYFLGYQINL